MKRSAKHQRRNFSTAVIACAVLLVIGNSTRGQGPQTPKSIEPDKVLGVSIDDTLRYELALHIDEITRVCQLDERQQAKLQVAAKGAVNQWHEDHVAEAGQRLTFSVGSLAYRRRGNPAGVDLAVFGQHGAALRQSIHHVPVWQRTLGGMLSSEQLDQLKIARKRRHEYRREAAIQEVVAKIDQALWFSVGQRNQLEQLLSEELKERNNINWARQLIAIHEIINVNRMAQIIPKQVLSGILSKEQMVKWTNLAKVNQQQGKLWLEE